MEKDVYSYRQCQHYRIRFELYHMWDWVIENVCFVFHVLFFSLKMAQGKVSTRENESWDFRKAHIK